MVIREDYKSDLQLAVTQDFLNWDLLANKSVLLTGASGLLGSCLVEMLLLRTDLRCTVFATGRHPLKCYPSLCRFASNPFFHFLQHDVTDPLCLDEDFDYIIHAASGATPSAFASSPVDVIKSNIFGVSNLLDYGRMHNMKRFLFVSSGEVYGEAQDVVFTEDCSGYVNCATPRACYPSSKRTAETLCVSYCAQYGVSAVIARPAHTFGPLFQTADNRVYAQFIRNVLAGQDIVLKSAGTQFRSWCYVVDCALGLLCILLNGEDAQAYNVADESSCISIRELADVIASIAGVKVVSSVPSDAESAGYNVVSKSVFSTSKLQSLGWSPLPGDLVSKFRKTIDYCKVVRSGKCL